jgi:hypothetical protein
MELGMQKKIGEFLLEIEVMKPYQVEDVLRAQKAGDTRLFGEIAIELGYINDEVLKKYVEAEEEWKKLTMRTDAPEQEGGVGKSTEG